MSHSASRNAPLLLAGALLVTGAILLAHAASMPESGRTGFAYGVLAVGGLSGAAFAWRRADRGAIVIVLVGAIVARAVLFAGEPIFSHDLYRYLWDGRVMLAGLDPLALAPNDPALARLSSTPLYALIDYRTIPSLYPPLAYALFYVGAVLGNGALGEKAVMLAGDVLVIVLLLLTLRRRELPLGRVAMYAWSPLVLLEFAQSGHLESWAIAGVVATAFAFAANRVAVGAGALVCAILIKLTPAAFLPIAFSRAPRWIVVCTLTCVAVYGVAYAFGIPASRSLEHYVSVQRFFPTIFAYAGPAVSALVFTTFLAAMTWRARAGQSFATGVIAVQTAFVLCSPSALPWYATLLPAMVSLVVRPNRAWRAALAALVVAASAFPLAYGPPAFPAQTTMTIVAAAVCLLAAAIGAWVLGIPVPDQRLRPAAALEDPV